MDKMFTENGKIRYKNYYLVLDNSTSYEWNEPSYEWNELPINLVKSITPVIDKQGKAVLLINYYDDEYCCNCTLTCDSIEFIREEEIIL